MIPTELKTENVPLATANCANAPVALDSAATAATSPIENRMLFLSRSSCRGGREAHVAGGRRCAHVSIAAWVLRLLLLSLRVAALLPTNNSTLSTPKHDSRMADSVLLTNVKHNLSLLDKAVELLEPRFATRALRSLPALRKKSGDNGQADVLAEVIRSDHIFPKGQSLWARDWTARPRR